MEQIQEPQKTDVNLRLRDLFKKSFEIRQIQLQVMKDIDSKYINFDFKPSEQIPYEKSI
jgi:hypothetical protein